MPAAYCIAAESTAGSAVFNLLAGALQSPWGTSLASFKSRRSRTTASQGRLLLGVGVDLLRAKLFACRSLS